jgi:hypothetical protein
MTSKVKTILIGSLILIALILNSSQLKAEDGPVPTGKAINSKYVTIVKHSFRFDQSNYPYNVVGILTNTNKLNITSIYILGQLFDKDGKLITSSFGSVKAQIRGSKGQTYLYGSASSKRRYYGKDWSDFDRILWEEAQMDVYGDNWIFKGLSPTEIRTFDFISHGLLKIKTKGTMESEDHKRLVKYYAKKLNMRYEYYRRYRIISVGGNLTTSDIRNILRSANKTFKKYSLFPRKSYTKLGMAEPINMMSSEERELVLLVNKYRKRKIKA